MILHLREFRCDNRNRRTLSSLCGGSWWNQVNRKDKSGMKLMIGSMINKVFHLCPPLIKYFKKVNIKRKILKSVKLGRHILYCGNTILYLYLLLLLFNCPVVSDSLWPHGLQHNRLPCPLSYPEICPSSCSLHQWCHPAISSSDTLFFSCPQLSQHQGCFNELSVHQITKILEFQCQHQSILSPY